MATDTAPTPTRRADFWKFWAGQTISNFGSSITIFALPLLVFHLTGSALDLAIVSAVTFLPYPLFGLLIGAWVDRMNRKRLMIVADVLRAVVLGSIPLLSVMGELSVAWIYVTAFVMATLTACFDSAQFAAVPSLVDHECLVTANGRIQASYAAAAVSGPLLAGLLVVVMPIEMLLLLDACSFLISACLLGLIRRSFNHAAGRPQIGIFQDIAEGLRYVTGHPVLRNILLLAVLSNFLGSTTYAQLVFFAKQQLRATDTETGLLYAAGSAGVVVLSLAAGRLRNHLSLGQVAVGAQVLSGVCTLGMALSGQYVVALLLWALISGLEVLFTINTGSLRQTIVPNHMLGRVISVAIVPALSAIPVGAFLGGLAIEWTHNVALVFGVVGVLRFLVPLAFGFTALGRAERYLSHPKTAPDSHGPDAVQRAL